VKEFVIYTALRLILFLATFGLISGVWMLLAEEINVFVALILALLVSGVASYFVLNRQRTAFAARVEQRAARASAAFEAHKAREDDDEPEGDRG
jgi:hypothetical protein